MKEETVIQRIIRYSKIVLTLKLNKTQLERAFEVSNKIKIRIFSKIYYNIMIQELDSRQFEINNQIRILLEPLFQGVNYGYSNLAHWALSQIEMQNGYILLEHDCIYNEKCKLISGYQCILFLSDYKDTTHDISEGSIYPIGEVFQILGNLKNVFGDCQDINKYLYTSLLNQSNKK
jgi:hypothetical protein